MTHAAGIDFDTDRPLSTPFFSLADWMPSCGFPCHCLWASECWRKWLRPQETDSEQG